MDRRSYKSSSLSLTACLSDKFSGRLSNLCGQKFGSRSHSSVEAQKAYQNSYVAPPALAAAKNPSQPAMSRVSQLLRRVKTERKSSQDAKLRRAKPVRINLGLGFRDFLRNSSIDGITSLREPKHPIQRSKMVHDQDLFASLNWPATQSPLQQEGES